MSEFEISLSRTHVRDGDDVKELFKTSVENADAYRECGGETPGDALRGLASEFDDVFGSEPRTDGGRGEYEDLLGTDCPQCDEEIDEGSLRWNGRAWEHKNPNAHPQAGHHRLFETNDSDDVSTHDDVVAEHDGAERLGGEFTSGDEHMLYDDVEDERVAPENACCECGEYGALRCSSCGRALCGMHSEVGGGFCADFTERDGEPGCEIGEEFQVAEHLIRGEC